MLFISLLLSDLIKSSFFFPDWRSASRGHSTQDSGVDVHTLFTKPSAAPTAAAFRNQGSVQTCRRTHPQQERRRCLPVLTWKTRAFVSLHSACGKRGQRGNLNQMLNHCLSYLWNAPMDCAFSFLSPHSGFHSTPCFFLDSSFSLTTNLCLTCPSPLWCLWCLLLSQPAVPALLSLILCLVPGQSVSVTYDSYWQERAEGQGIDGRQVTASVRSGLVEF